MPFSFSPEQQGQPNAGQVASEAPPLYVPEAPVITTSAPVEVISPFAYKNRHKSNFGIYFQSVIFAIFGVLAIVATGLFSYQRVLIVQLNNKKQDLESRQANFPKIDTNEMLAMSNRIGIVNKTINERASVNTAFKLLEAAILDNTVTYTKFSLSKDKNKKSKIYGLSFSGETYSYAALYQQIAALNNKQFARYFSKIAISGTGPLDKKGIGNFKADTEVSIAGVDPDTFTLDTTTGTSSVGSASSTINGGTLPMTGTSTP